MQDTQKHITFTELSIHRKANMHTRHVDTYNIHRNMLYLHIEKIKHDQIQKIKLHTLDVHWPYE